MDKVYENGTTMQNIINFRKRILPNSYYIFENYFPIKDSL